MMLVVSSDAHHAHHSLELDRGTLVPSWEGPDRADLVLAALESQGHEFCAPNQADLGLIRRIHTNDYVDFLSTAWDRWVKLDGFGPAAMGVVWPSRGLSTRRPSDLIGQLGYYSFAADCSIVSATWTAAVAAAAVATTAADRLVDDKATTYGLCRPPGHHATADQFGGYCYLNNAALAAQRLLDRGAERVAVLDVDYHHGNGTQSIFYERADVLFVSIHADPMDEFPWFAGYAEEEGSGQGIGSNLNLPLPYGTDFDRYGRALDTALAKVDSASADALVISLGVDTFEDDPISKFELTTRDYPAMASRIAELGLPTVVIQEGGYAVEAIGQNVAGFLSGFE